MKSTWMISRARFPGGWRLRGRRRPGAGRLHLRVQKGVVGSSSRAGPSLDVYGNVKQMWVLPTKMATYS